MKRIFAFVVLMFALGTASAEWVLRTNNTNGGEIILTNGAKGCPSGKLVAVARSKHGELFTGCYSYDDDYIYVRWDNGDYRAYDWKGWEINPKFNNKKQGVSL